MAVVLPGKFIYLATMHTASSAVTTALRQIPGTLQPKDPRAGVGQHATLAQVKSVCEGQLSGMEVVFAAVRNPYDVFVTWYLRNRKHFRVPKNATLLEFLRAWVELDSKPHMHKRRMFFVADDVRHVMRYERGVTEELNGVLRKIPMMPAVEVPRENVTHGKLHWSTYYDRETYAFVNETFAADISRYGYCFVWE